MQTTDRLNWLIENEAYSLLDSDNYGPEWFERSRFELVRETIDIAMDAPIAEGIGDVRVSGG